jgi:nucleotide-binding universal stress UspA family protein
VVYSGKPLVTIIEEFANDFDLIVMGIDRETDLLKTIFGSMAFRIIQSTGIPLILVPEDYTYKKIDKIAFAFDPYEKRPTEINQLIEWAGYLKSDIQLLEGVKEINADKSAVEESKGSPVIAVDQIDRNQLIPEIHTYMQSGNADMIALYARDRGFFEKLFHKSVIRKLAVMADYPILVFHN